MKNDGLKGEIIALLNFVRRKMTCEKDKQIVARILQDLLDLTSEEIAAKYLL